jgi:hypothetical protein
VANDNDPKAKVGEHWLVYVTSLPVDDPAARMRILRTLDSLGCAAMREGVFVLPDSAANRLGLSRLSEHVTRINGSAHLLQVTSDEAQGQAFRAFFDRSGKYDELVKNVQSLRMGFGVSDPGALARLLNKQRRDFDALSGLDFFPSEARDRAAKALSEVESQVRALMFPDAPKEGRVTESGRQYFKSVWATKKPIWTDRLASAWLIRRFIDPEAKLLWLEKSEACPPTAVGFAFEGAQFCNSKTRVTFEELMFHFGLAGNATLVRIGKLVHALDAGGTPVPEAAGVETLLQGARRRSTSDDELLSESEKTFDLLFEAYFETPAKT